MSDNWIDRLAANKEQEAFEALCKKLEAERNDISYRLQAPKVTPTETEKQREQRDAIFYNAGRFMAGATDKTALKAHQALQKLLQED